MSQVNLPVGVERPLYYFILNMHYYIFFVGFLVRYFRHRNLGKNSLNDPRPFTYKLKMFLQSIMALITWVMIYDTEKNGNYQYFGIAYLMYGWIWILGIYLQYFEYERGLPHAWYTHQTFWILGFILNIIFFAFLIYFEHIFSNPDESDMNDHMRIKNIIVSIVSLLILMVLSYLGIRYKREFPQHLRNYLPPQQTNAKKRFTEYERPLINDDNKYSQAQGAVVLRIPIIRATVTSYAIDNGTVNFKIIVYKDNLAHQKLKKTFNDFYELDQMLESKYSKYIKQGIIIKGELPKKDQYNFNKIKSIEQLKNALKSYIEVLNNQPNTFINDHKDEIQSKNASYGLSNYLPKEYLLFLNIDLRIIDPIMELQEQKLNPQSQQEELNESQLYGKGLDIVIKRTDNLKEDIRHFLLKVLKREELYRIKIDCIQKSSGVMSIDETNSKQVNDQEGIIFTFQINNCFVFNKTLKEVDKFCKDIVHEFKNPLIQMMADLFNFCSNASISQNVNRVTSGSNSNNPSRFSENLQGVDISQRYKMLYQELEHASQQLEGYFKLILNDPDFYCDHIYKFFNCHQIFQLFPYVSVFREQNKDVFQQQQQLQTTKQLHQQQSSQTLQQQSDQNIIQEIEEEKQMDDDENNSIKNPFKQGNRPKPSLQKAQRPHRFQEDLKVNKGQSIQGFIGISVSCKVKKQSIQIYADHPTNIFTIEVTKKYLVNDESVVESWNIKLSLAQVISLANSLNIKYSNTDRNLPELLMSLIQFQGQVNQTFQNDQKIMELENYLNQLFSMDTIIYSPAVRSLFKFDKSLKKVHEYKGENKDYKSGFLGSKKDSSEGKGGILDSEGQVEDYFNADKNPFSRPGEGSINDNSFFVQGIMKKKHDFESDEETGVRLDEVGSGIMGGLLPITTEYFKQYDQDDESQ